MRILHVLDHSIPLQSGYTFRTRAILREQHRRGWHTAHITSAKHNPDRTVPAAEIVDDLTFYRCQASRNPAARLPVVGQLATVTDLSKRLVEVAAQERPDIVHAHSPALNGVAAIQARGRLGLPVVYEVRGFWEDAAVSHGTSREGGLRYRLTRAMETWALQRADAVTCICEGIRGDLMARGISSEKIVLVPNAVDAERFTPIEYRDPTLEARYGLAGKKVLGFIGSFYAYEGLGLLVEAMPRLLDARPEVRLLLVGGGQVAEQLQQRVSELGIAREVVMTGRVPHDQVEAHYSLTDLLVYPRMPMRITELVTPLKPLEAMAQKRVLIASDVGGHRELIRDGVTGTLFRAGDVDDLVRKVLELFDAEERWPAMREAGRAYVERERTWRNSVENLVPVYERLTSRS